MAHGNERRKISNKEEESKARWENLEINILSHIFRHLTRKELCSSVSWVCSSWRGACFEVLFWRNINVLDFGEFGLFYKKLISCSEPKEEQTKKMIKVVKMIMEGHDTEGFPLEAWCNSIRTIYFPDGFRLPEGVLLYIAQRTPHLKNLILLEPSVHLLSVARNNWKELKTILLGPDYNPDHHLFVKKWKSLVFKFSSIWGEARSPHRSSVLLCTDMTTQMNILKAIGEFDEAKTLWYGVIFDRHYATMIKVRQKLFQAM